MFLGRILRNWKNIAIQGYETLIDGWVIDENENKIVNKINMVRNDRLRIHTFEVAGSAITY